MKSAVITMSFLTITLPMRSNYFRYIHDLSKLLFSCYEKSKLRDFVNQTEIFAALLAGLGHDLNHSKKIFYTRGGQ
jgi:hypothetical protein